MIIMYQKNNLTVHVTSLFVLFMCGTTVICIIVYKDGEWIDMKLSHVIDLFPCKKGSVHVYDTKSVAMLRNRKLLHVASTNEKLKIYIRVYMVHHIYKYTIQSFAFIMSLSSCHKCPGR